MMADATDRNEQRLYELVTTVTTDHVKLHGLFQRSSQSPATSIDAAVVLHGLGGNFYSSTLNLRLADALVEMGISVVLANTRGHDGISMSPVGGRAKTIGAAYEIVGDCKHDIFSWVDWLSGKRGFSDVALIGHSLGAIKSLYAQAYSPHDSVKALIGLSATRLCHERLMKSPKGDEFKKWYSMAKDLIQLGKGRELIPVEFPFPTWMSAEAYVSKYGPEDHYDWIRFVDRVQIPTLLMFGERELRDNPAFDGLWETASEVASRLANFEARQIASANHFYAGVHHRATAAMQKWLALYFQSTR